LSSGFFYSREVIEKIGLKNEDLFIDLVDWEWCWRARSKDTKFL
jgi:rhamnosyltransferase